VFRKVLVALAFAVCSVSVAWAHPAPFSYLDVVFKDAGIEGTLVVHVIDVAHELGVTPEQVMDAAFVAAQQQRIGEILAPRLDLRGGDQRLSIEWQGLELMKEEQALRLRYRIRNADSGALSIDTNLFPYDPLHQTFINVYEEGALRQQIIFNNETNAHIYYRGTTQGAIEVMKVFIPSGTHHILIGPDHILFLVGLLLLGGTMRQLLFVVTGFTVAHSITLSLAALEIVTPPARLIEPAIALSIVYVGADNILAKGGRDVRVWIAFTFGFIHGFGFANVLREMDLPARALGWSLFAFNVGVEIGQLLVVVLVASAFQGLRSRSEWAGRHLALAGSVVVILAGAFWFVQRVFFPGGIS